MLMHPCSYSVHGVIFAIVAASVLQRMAQKVQLPHEKYAALAAQLTDNARLDELHWYVMVWPLVYGIWTHLAIGI